MNILKVDSIVKHYGYIKALQGISFSVPRGSVYGILGPNGSGKTTLLEIVTDVLKADSGDYVLFGDEVAQKNEQRKKIGTLLETPNFYHYLSAYDNLEIAAEIKGADKTDIDRVLHKVGLYQRRKSCFNTFSLGMKQRLGIASALLGNPEMLILDEPTNGLDPEGIAEIRSLIKELGRSGYTIVIASHLLDEVEKVCSHVAILKNGRLLAAGSTGEILAGEDIIEIGCTDMDALHAILTETYPDCKIIRENTYVQLCVPHNSLNAGELNGMCLSKGIILDRLVLRKQSMENIFLEVVNNSEKRQI